MASSLELQRRIEDITRCPICLDAFEDARFLPCGHTFCQGCIEGCQASIVGVSCPVCRRNSVVLLYCQIQAGRTDLPKNLVAEDLAEVARTLNTAGDPQAPVRGLLPVPTGPAVNSRTTRRRSRRVQAVLRICGWIWKIAKFIAVILLIASMLKADFNDLPEPRKLELLTTATESCRAFANSITGSKKEHGLLSRMRSFLKQTCGLKEDEKKPLTLWEQLKEHLQRKAHEFCDSLEEIRRKELAGEE